MADFKPIPLKELMALEFPETEWLIERIIAPASFTIVSAAPNSYKTWLLLEMARCIASGEPLFGKFETTATGVLFIDAEMNSRMLNQRCTALACNEDLPITFMTEQDFVLDEKRVDSLIGYCRSHEIGLVIFDSLVRLHAFDENSARDMAQVNRLLRRFTNGGLTVVASHHHRKTGQGQFDAAQALRGSSELLGGVDTHFAVTRLRTSTTATLDNTKQRTDRELPRFNIALTSNGTTVSLEFAGFLETAEQLPPKPQQVAPLIHAYLKADQAAVTFTGIQEHLADINFDIGQGSLRTALKQMVKPGNLHLIYEQRGGSKNTKYYTDDAPKFKSGKTTPT